MKGFYQKKDSVLASIKKYIHVSFQLIAIAMVVIGTGVHCGGKLSGSEKRSIQIREYNASKGKVIEVLKTVLQDEGYQIKTASSSQVLGEKTQKKSFPKKIFTRGDEETIQVDLTVSGEESNRSRIRMRIRRLEEGKATVEIEKEKEYEYLFKQISELLSQS